jgi:flagellar protein FliO/FliZ
MTHAAAPLGAAVLLGVPGAVFAQAVPAADAPLAGSLLQTTLGLVLVLALIAGAAWLARRFAPGAARGALPLPVVASQAVGQRERVVVVEVGDQWLVLGVAPGQVNALATLPRGELRPATPSPLADSFAASLARALGKRN